MQHFVKVPSSLYIIGLLAKLNVDMFNVLTYYV